MKKIKFPLLIFTTLILLCDTTFASSQLSEAPIRAPENLEEAEQMGKNILWGFPEAIKKPWQEALSFWKRAGNWFLKWLRIIWQKICLFFGKEVEIKKTDVQKKLEREKQELKEEVSGGTKSLWQRFKELIF